VKNISYTYVLFCLGLLSVLIASNDNFLSILPIYHKTTFQDLKYIFEYADCLNEISNINCAFYEYHPFVYPSIWLLIARYVNLYYGTIFYLLLVFLYLIVSIITFKDINRKYIYHFLFFFSPASLLLIIRANNDILIFFIIYLLIKILENNKNKIISFLLFLLSYLLKIYSIFLILIFFLKKKDFNIKNYFLFLLFAIITFYFIHEILTIDKTYNKSGIIASYSSQSIFDLFNYLNFKIKINTKIFSIISLLLLIALSFSKLNKINSNISKKSYLLFITGSIVLVSNFFLSKTFDYRLIFILLIIPAIFEIKKNENSYLINTIIICIFSIMWFETIIFYYSKYINYETNKLVYLENKHLKIIILGLFVALKNILQWIVNIYLIFLCKNIILKNFNR